MTQEEALELARSIGLKTAEPEMVEVSNRAALGSEVFRLLSEAGAKCVEAAPSQEFLDEFNQRLQGLKDFMTRRPGAASAVVGGGRRVFLGMPRSYECHLEVLKAAWCDSTMDQQKTIVKIADKPVPSLLAFGFNQLWCECYNGLDAPYGGEYDYFAMLHADVRPAGEGWLDVMLREMEQYNLDVLHAPCALKDTDGLTSTAVGGMDDDWAPVRRLSMTELQDLPLTFDVGDVLAKFPLHELPQNPCLLPNTGCLLVKLGPWKSKFPGFAIRDRLCDLSDGKKVPQVVPEDWGFGRWCARNGLIVGCTRLVKTSHYGRIEYVNWSDWGTKKTDEVFFNNRGAYGRLQQDKGRDGGPDAKGARATVPPSDQRS